MWFIRRGVPHFIEDYSATQDVFTRALPALSLVFVFEMFGALNLDWPLLVNILALPAGLAALIGAWALVNRARGRQPLARALPLLLLFGVFLFLTPEIWQVSESMQGPFFWAVVGLFFFLGTLFLVTRLPREVRELATYQSAEELCDHLVGTPAEALAIETLPEPPALSVTAVTDDTYRKEFFEDVVAEIRQALAVRAAYLAARPKFAGQEGRRDRMV